MIEYASVLKEVESSPFNKQYALNNARVRRYMKLVTLALKHREKFRSQYRLLRLRHLFAGPRPQTMKEGQS